MSTTLHIDGDRLLKRLDQFAAIGATPGGGVNRPALSALDQQARRLLSELAFARGFRVEQDQMANLYIRREGAANVPPFVIGSHLDSQPMGGRFDGALGVLAAFEVLETLEDRSVETHTPVEVVVWTNEEGSRFAPGAMGSRAFSSGAIPPEWKEAKDQDGVGLDQELTATVAALPEAPLRPLGAPIAGYLELHIEQGPVLEEEEIPVGIVTGIQGTRWLKISVSGEAAHAGTTGLAFRKDALAASTSVMKRFYDEIMPKDQNARLTIGRLSVSPGSINTIPAAVDFYVDLRHRNNERLNDLEARVRDICLAETRSTGCQVVIEKVLDMAPVAFPDKMIEVTEEAARKLGLPARRLVSGAFHDALFVAGVAPAGMIFVPCRKGRSHCEDEHVEPSATIAGCNLLLHTAIGYCKLNVG
ncbi:Zn-dependent hydrolase [Allorhizobium sp. BGMRC 0089]|uniref:Zn-dependent hydrolase n=1 Tax=Allorhizobium sonneratiae TaxID=2934936 RepID=UPI0020343BDC|nr:Zn-dependent hydrolase [Allorhizobium sonneratiae]MCM2292570.1 Zn-dependent hydrolase [Allorhizobium sonneratiae]